MPKVLAVILGGGRGTRLFPLTAFRSKPAVPLGGKYRLVDVPISNCLNSGIRDMYVLTQFNSESLNRHIVRTYALDPFSSGSVEIIAAQQTFTDTTWYQGTADAVRQNLKYFRRRGLTEILILSGDQLYQMDFNAILRFHRQQKADVTVSVIPVRREQASSLGVLKSDATGRITRFDEKPTDESVLDELAAPKEVIDSAGFTDSERTHIASMGMYVFSSGVLERVLEGTDATDFGKEVIPNAIGSMRVFSYVFNGYWEDIGTIKTFHSANLALASPCPPFDFYSEKQRVFSRPRFLPCSKVNASRLRSCVLSDGSILDESEIEESIIGLRSIIARGTAVRRTVLMGADFYETEKNKTENRRRGRPDIGVGPGCIIENAIIDKNARIGEGVSIIGGEGRQDAEGEGFCIRDGIVVIPKNAVIPAGAEV